MTTRAESDSGDQGRENGERGHEARFAAGDGLPGRTTPRRYLWGLRARLLLLVGLSVLPALGVIGYTAQRQRAQATATAQDQAIAVAQQIGLREAQRIRHTRQLLALLAHLPQVRSGTTNCHSFLAGILARSPQYANFAIIAADAHVRCSAVEFRQPVDPAREAFFQRASKTHAFSLGNYQIGQMTRLPVLVAAYPLLDPQGRVTALLIAAMKLNEIDILSKDMRLPAGATLTVLDPTGQVLFHYPHGQRWLGKALANTPLGRVLHTVAGSGVVHTGGPDGVSSLYAFSRVRHLGSSHDLHVILGIPTTIAYTQVYRTTRRELLLLTLTTAVVFILAWLGGTVFVIRPVHALLAATRRLATGDLTARTYALRGGSELGELAADFDAMAGGLERRAAEIAEKTRRVERLNRVYRVLSGINSALLRIREREALLTEACRIAVDQGGFQLAWIGMVDPESGDVVPTAWAGSGQDYVKGIRISMQEDVPEGGGPIGHALRSSKYMVCNDIEQDSHMALWRENARAFGLRSMAAFPLQLQQRAIGALALYADEPGFFDTEEIRLLEELAADTGLGLEYIEQERQLRHLAYYDALTGLANRTLFYDRLGQALARGRRTSGRTAVLAIGLIQFRTVSDTLGRHAGDQALCEIGARLTGVVRTSDTVARFGTHTVARLGGNEFALLLADIKHPHEVDIITQRALKAIRDPMAIEAEAVVLDARVGIALGPEDGKDPEALLAHAELALHSISAADEEQIRFYAPDLNVRTQERHALEHALRLAIERDEFILHYQPQVELAQGRIVGAEALLRWRHPEKGLVSPAAFIPLLEDTGLISVVGDWVLRTACAQQVEWRDATGVAVKMAVNVSARQFQDLRLPARVAEIVSETGIESGTLELEVTETIYMGNAARTVDALRAFKASGVHLSIDDFGTGYSSLGYLRRFPVDMLKIDQSFVQDMTSDPDSFLIARSVVAIAHGLGMRVIAEGVETAGQLRLLAREGCDEVQGYFFSKPIPAQEFRELLRTGAQFPVPEPAPYGDPATILVVGGGPDVAAALGRVLDPGEYRIMTAGNTAGAFETLAAHDVAVVLTGEEVFGTTGAEFMRRVRRIYPDTTRIMLARDTARRGTTEPLGQDPVAEYVQLPLDEEHLRRRVREAVRQRLGPPVGQHS
ncbi:MAG TPA: EAL domain-containing protein [Gammaproteobacteria bacterium]|nr:EAL domain-containing protein [Gammaproteobacteria bacterium]